jgi:hypothetical protein
MWHVVLQRTARVKLAVPDERRDDLKRTMRAFNDAAQMFADRGWAGNDEGYVITARPGCSRLSTPTCATNWDCTVTCASEQSTSQPTVFGARSNV